MTGKAEVRIDISLTTARSNSSDTRTTDPPRRLRYRHTFHR